MFSLHCTGTACFVAKLSRSEAIFELVLGTGGGAQRAVPAEAPQRVRGVRVREPGGHRAATRQEEEGGGGGQEEGAGAGGEEEEGR